MSVRAAMSSGEACAWQLDCTQRALAVATAYLDQLARAHPNKSVEIRNVLTEILRERNSAPALITVPDEAP